MALKPWIREVGGVYYGLYDNDVPIYTEECCCENCPSCAWVVVSITTGTLVDTYQFQIDRTYGPATCTGQPGDTIACIWSYAPCGFDGLGSFSAKKYCDGSAQVWVNGHASDVIIGLTAIYADYTTFQGYPEISCHIEERTLSLCDGGFYCVAYKKVGSSYDVARVIVPACALPQYYQFGWTEDYPPYYIDYFDCEVVSGPGATIGNCYYTESYIYQTLCAVSSYDNGATWSSEHNLTPCVPFPASGMQACTLYDTMQRWFLDYGSDANTLYQHWDGHCEYSLGGSSRIPKQESTTGPYGTYTSGSSIWLVYACYTP